MWWQWDMTNTPFVYDGGNLEVSYQDSTFQDVIAPESKSILAAAASTVSGCAKINQKSGTTSTASAGRRLLGA